MRTSERRRNAQNKRLKTASWFIVIIFISGFYIKNLYNEINSLRDRVLSNQSQIDSQQNYINNLIYKIDSASKKEEVMPIPEAKKEVYYQPTIKKDTIKVVKKDSILDTLNKN